MKKLVLFFAVAATISFAACNNTSKEQPEAEAPVVEQPVAPVVEQPAVVDTTVQATPAVAAPAPEVKK